METIEQHHASENNLTGDRHKALRDAVEMLYIRNNQSGRIHFMQEWPAVARYVFGEDLLRSDAMGGATREERAALEQAAETRRLQLLEITETFEQKSVDQGFLKKDYVENLIRTLGRDIALFLYTEKIVDRVLPPPPKPEADVVAEVVPEPELPVIKDPRDQIQPIAMVVEPVHEKRPGDDPGIPIVPKFEDLRKIVRL